MMEKQRKIIIIILMIRQ